MKDIDIVVGEVVQLASGGPPMVVVEVDRLGRLSYRCFYFSRGELGECTVPASALRIGRPRDKVTT